MCREIGQVMAVNVHCDLHAQCHVLVQSDDGHHHHIHMLWLNTPNIILTDLVVFFSSIVLWTVTIVSVASRPCNLATFNSHFD